LPCHVPFVVGRGQRLKWRRGKPPLAFIIVYVYSINMANKDNSVNIKNDGAIKAGYHHGDLRDALIRAGVAALDDGLGAADLSLRGLARAAGVSATAVYRHFPDKAALLGALAEAGLDRLGATQQVAAQQAEAQGPLASFAASGSAYVRFALAHPALFRLIWSTAPTGDLFAASVADSHPAMTGLRNGIAAILPPDASAEAQRAAALSCWSLVHGLAMLALDRQIMLDDATIDRVVGGLTTAFERARA
jgi:AcrR family transcriptional regulator